MKLYDENEAVAFIRFRISDAAISDDDILDVIDAIFDYYDQNGDLDLDIDDDESESDDDIDSIVSFATQSLADTTLSPTIIEEIIKAELAYEQSLL